MDTETVRTIFLIIGIMAIVFVLGLGYFVNSSIRIQYRLWREAGAFKVRGEE
jgi:hypothetical protein